MLTSEKLKYPLLVFVGLVIGSILFWGYSASKNAPLKNSADSQDSFDTGLFYGQFPKKLVSLSVWDAEKYENTVSPLTKEEKSVFENDSGKIIITPENLQFFLNLFWGLGLSQKNEFVENSELGRMKNAGQLSQLASVGGWEISRDSAENHFSKYDILPLTAEQKKMVSDMAAGIYRPCCNNHSRFADCNHGMAMLGLLELGASQGLNQNQLYKLALIFNFYWFPDEYRQISEYFELIKNRKLVSVDPKIILSYEFSSASGFSENVQQQLALLNKENSLGSGSSCSL